MHRIGDIDKVMEDYYQNKRVTLDVLCDTFDMDSEGNCIGCPYDHDGSWCRLYSGQYVPEEQLDDIANARADALRKIKGTQ